MKNSAEYAARIKKFLTRLKKSAKDMPLPVIPADPLRGLLLACLSAHTTEAKALTVMKKLDQEFVDLNELRVCRACEVVEVIGKTISNASLIAEQVLGLLNSIMEEHDDLNLNSLAEMGKREAKADLEKIRNIDPYMTAWVMMRCLQGHSFPLNQKMYDMLLREELINPKSDLNDVQGFLERHIASNELIETYELLRYHCDHLGNDAKALKKDAEAPKKKKTTAPGSPPRKKNGKDHPDNNP